MAEDSDDSSSTQYKKVPTHILVQKQMQDLIALQKSRVAKLENDVRSIYMYVRVSKAAKSLHMSKREFPNSDFSEYGSPINKSCVRCFLLGHFSCTQGLIGSFIGSFSKLRHQILSLFEQQIWTRKLRNAEQTLFQSEDKSILNRY